MMQRYKLHQGNFREHPNGKWVKWEDVQAIVDKLPKCWRLVDGKLVKDVPYLPFGDDRTFYALWHYSEEDALVLSPCYTPQDAEECQWVIEAAEEECLVESVCNSPEAAEAARDE